MTGNPQLDVAIGIAIGIVITIIIFAFFSFVGGRK